LGFSWPYLSKKEEKTMLLFQTGLLVLSSIFVLFEKEKSIPIQGNHSIACSQGRCQRVGLENYKIGD
jgi:hypothetical protein